MTALACPPRHLAYLSSMLATNAVTLHRLAYPECGGYGSWPCGDHFHVGHSSPEVGDRCKAAGEAADLERRRRKGRA
jgi:hypothetical protein